MSQMFAVLSVEEGQPAPSFTLVQADEAAQALAATAQSLIEKGHEQAQLVAVFTREDLQGLLTQMDQVKQG